MTKTNTKAFTLIELLIVIVIIGILAVALIPRLTGSQKQARDTARKAGVQQITTAIESYKIDNNGALPPTGNPVAQLSAFMSSFPKDPKSGDMTGANGFQYYTGTNAEYVVFSNLEGNGGNAAGSTTTWSWASLSGPSLDTGSGYKVIVK